MANFEHFALLLASGSEAANLPLAMLVVFASAKILDELFERFNQPGNRWPDSPAL